MKRSFLISLLLHGAVLLLFFSWGIPLDGGPFARNVIQVLLVAEEEEGNEKGGLKKEKNDEWKNETPKREAATRNDSLGKKLPPKKAKPIVENPKRKPEALAPTPLAREDEENGKQKPKWEHHCGCIWTIQSL